MLFPNIDMQVHCIGHKSNDFHPFFAKTEKLILRCLWNYDRLWISRQCWSRRTKYGDSHFQLLNYKAVIIKTCSFHVRAVTPAEQWVPIWVSPSAGCLQMRTVSIHGVGQMETVLLLLLLFCLFWNRSWPQTHVILLPQPPKFCITDIILCLEFCFLFQWCGACLCSQNSGDGGKISSLRLGWDV